MEPQLHKKRTMYNKHSKNVHIIILGYGILFQIYACAQTNKNKQTMLQEIIQTVQTYKEKPEYRLQVYSANCNWEILLNDMPVYLNRAPYSGFSSSLPLNHLILQSGKQELALKIFPMKGQFTLGKAATFKVGLKLKKDIHNANDFAFLFDYAIPTDSIKDLPFFEYKHTFEAKLPYTLAGWSKSKDLRNIPDLEKKLLKKYDEVLGIIKRRDENSFLKLMFDAEKEKYQAFYATPQKIKEDFLGERFPDESELGDIKFLPINNYKLQYYANGRVVALENIENPDEGVIRFDAIIKKTKEPYRGFFNVRFRIPEHSTELEAIR